MPSDPHIQLICGLYQAFYGSYLPIAADQPFLCLLRHLIQTAVPDLARQLRLAARVREIAYAAKYSIRAPRHHVHLLSNKSCSRFKSLLTTPDYDRSGAGSWEVAIPRKDFRVKQENLQLPARMMNRTALVHRFQLMRRRLAVGAAQPTCT